VVIQRRPLNSRAETRDAYYAPERDVAYLGPGLLRHAMLALEEQWWEPWFRQYAEEHGVTAEDLISAAKPFAEGVNKIIRAKDPVVALTESGFTELDPAVQAAFYIKIGQVFLAAVFVGVKDVSRPESDPPADIQDMLNDADEVLRHFSSGGEHDSYPGGEPDAPDQGTDA